MPDTGITIKTIGLRLFHNDSAGASYLTSYRGVERLNDLLLNLGMILTYQEAVGQRIW